MNSSESSLESSVDSVDGFKAAQAAQFSKLHSAPNPLKFQEAQMNGFHTDDTPPKPPTKSYPRSGYVDQTADARPRSKGHGHVPTSAAELLELLATNKETEETRRLLHNALTQLDASYRPDMVLESTKKLALVSQKFSDASAAQHKAATAQAQLTMYEVQLNAARAEIERAQDVVRMLEAQRDDAEESAGKARSLARRLHTENKAHVARAEGHKDGFNEGYEHGRMIAAAAARERERREQEQRRRLAEAETRIEQQQQEMRAALAAARHAERTARRRSGRTSTAASRAVEADPQPPPPQHQPPPPQRRRSARSVPQQQAQPEPPPPVAPAESAPAQPPPPVTVVINNNQPAPQQPQRPASVSVSSSGHTAAGPPVPPEQQTPHPRVTSIDFAAPSRAPPVSHAASRSRASVSSNASRPPAGLPPPNASTSQLSVSSVGSRNTPRNSTAAPAPPPPSGSHRRAASASTLATLDEEAMRPRPPMSMEGLIRNIPPPVIPPPAPVPMPIPERIIVMPPHVPMPQPPMGTMPPSGPPMPMPMTMPVPPAPPQFEVERPEPSERRERDSRNNNNNNNNKAQSPSSVSTSLRTLRLTSFPAAGVAGSAAGSERSHSAAGGYGGGAGDRGGGGRDRERELSTIIEHATGESQQIGGSSSWGTISRQPSWTRRSSPYTDPRGMEEWRRETDVEGVRPPPSPVTSPGLLSPYGTIQASNVQQRPSQESFGSTNLRRSSSGSSSQTIGITIEPPSRPASIGIHAAGNQPPAEGSAHLLSPNHQPVLLAEDDEESDDNDDSDSDDAPMPPGFVMGPLPAFAQGVSPLPPGFVPTPSGTQARSLQGGSSWGAPPQPPPAQPIPTNANANAAWSLPSFPAPAGGAGNPVTITGTWGTPAASGASTGNPAIVNATWAPRVAPPHLPGPPVSTGAGIYGGVPANPAFGARAAPPLTVEPVTRPASRNAMPGGFNVEPVVRPASRLGGMPAAAAGVGAEPPRPPSRQMGGILGNPASGFTVEPVVRPSSRIGISSGSFTAEPSATRPFGGMPGGNSALGSFAVESATRPPSRGPVPGNTTSGLTVESSRHPLPIRVGAQPGNSFTVEPARPPSRLGNPVSGGFGAEPGAQPPSRLGNLHTGGFTVEPARPQSRQGMHATSAWGGPAVVGGNPVGPQQASGSSFPSNAASSNKWSMSGQFGFGQGSTPSAQPMRPLGFAPPPTADSAGSAGTAPRSPLPTRLRTFADNPSERSTTPRPSLYGPPAPTAAPSGTGYFAPTPGVAAGYPLPTSRSNSTATTMSHPRIANVNAGTTPAAFNTTALSRPTSQSSSGGRSRFNNQTPHPSTNLGITDPYTTARIEQDDSSSDGEGSLGGLARMTSFDRVTATNTRANAGGAGGIYAGGGGFGAPFIPPSPANSYRPMR